MPRPSSTPSTSPRSSTRWRSSSTTIGHPTVVPSNWRMSPPSNSPNSRSYSLRSTRTGTRRFFLIQDRNRKILLDPEPDPEPDEKLSRCPCTHWNRRRKVVDFHQSSVIRPLMIQMRIRVGALLHPFLVATS